RERDVVDRTEKPQRRGGGHDVLERLALPRFEQRPGAGRRVGGDQVAELGVEGRAELGADAGLQLESARKRLIGHGAAMRPSKRGRSILIDQVNSGPTGASAAVSNGSSACIASSNASIGSLPISASFTGPQAIRCNGQGPSLSNASACTGAR